MAELSATSIVKTAEYAYLEHSVFISYSEIIATTEEASLGVAIPLFSSPDLIALADISSPQSRAIQSAILLSSRDVIRVSESIRFAIGVGLECVSSASAYAHINIRVGDAFWPTKDIVGTYTEAKLLGKWINPFILFSPIPAIARAGELFSLEWGGLLPDDWDYPDLKSTGLTYPILKLPVLGLEFERIMPVRERPMLDKIWNIGQHEAKLSASFSDFNPMDITEQGFIVWHYDKDNDLVSGIQKVNVTEFRNFWSRSINGLFKNTDYYAVAFVTTRDNKFAASSPEAFTTRKSPKLFDLMTPYIRLEDLQLGSDLKEFLEILQITLDQQEANISEALQYKSVNDIPERFLQNLADNIGGQIDKYLSLENNRTSLKEFMPWVSVRGSQTSFDIIFNKLQMACSIVNQATKIIIPSYQGRLSYEDAYIMDQFYYHEGALDINISWFGRQGKTAFPIYDRVYEELEKVWPAGFLLYLTVRIALTTDKWESWLKTTSTVQKSKNFTWHQDFWQDECNGKDDYDNRVTSIWKITGHTSRSYDFAYRFSNTMLQADSNHYTLLSRYDAFSRKPIRINSTALEERKAANSGEPIQYRPSIKRYVRKTRYTEKDFLEYWLPDYSLDTDTEYPRWCDVPTWKDHKTWGTPLREREAYVEQTKNLEPLIWAQTYFRSHCFCGYDWEMSYEFDILKAVNLHIGIMPLLTQHIVESDAVKPIEMDKLALARISMGNLPIYTTQMMVTESPSIPVYIHMEKPRMSVGNLPALTRVTFISNDVSGDKKEQ